MSLEYFAVAPPGIEGVVALELERAGLGPVAPEPGGVSFGGGKGALYRACLEVRTASRITMRIGQFEARTWFELERHVAKVDWGSILPAGMALDLEVTSRKSRLYHQKGIAERIARVVGAPAPQPGAPAQRVVVRVVRDRFLLSADASGELLHRRGYRLATAKAPLRETLAAAMLLATGWDGTTPLVDPFTGSGTIPIEAAMLARRMAPGLGRRHAFEAWPSLDGPLWQRTVAAARAAVLPGVGVPIVGSDRDAGAIRAALANAERAGVAGDIAFRTAALSSLAAPAEPGLLLANPPWGARVSDSTDLRNLHAQLGNVARRVLPGWRVALLVADRALAAQAGLAWQEAFATTSGGIRVALVMAGVPVAPTVAGTR